ncbi:PREDICTED: E3 ubiquitin-protein ligase MARCH8-like [Nicotiana attenuata]|uniref:E3 ubiquitin-protein ligase MARCH8-like n=1 Tax=Nicotiana attenuata TaxID=49451 RepID=UPI000905487C|nr:PREDICTED: E3 ubiquitin-protein ligase MARCH8-like [Nicotiana attenuata]
MEEIKEDETKQGEDDGNLNTTKCGGNSEKVSSNGERQELGEKIEKGTEVVIDIDENQGMEKVCRICHLNEESKEIIELGCDCKSELGICHRHCAEAWFNQRGNRSCEICEKTAKNVQIRLQESRIMVTEWNEGAVEPINSYTTTSSTTENACLRRCQQYFCNLLLACLVIYFLFILHSFNAKK